MERTGALREVWRRGVAMNGLMRGSNQILPWLGPPVQILPQEQDPLHSSVSTCCSTTLSCNFQPCRRVPRHSSDAIRSIPRHQRQGLLLLDCKLRSVSFCVKYVPCSSFHGDVRALKQQGPPPKENFKDAFNLHRTKEPTRSLDVKSGLQLRLPSVSVDQSKTGDSNAPGKLDQGISPSTIEVGQPGSKASSKPVPTVSTITKPRRSLTAEESTSDQGAPTPNKGRPGPRVETSYIPGKRRLPGSSNRISSGSPNPNFSKQIDARAESKNVISNQTVWRSPDGGAHWPSNGAANQMSYGKSGARVEPADGVVDSASEAIATLQNRLQRGITVDSSTYIEVLQMCSKPKDLLAAKQVHDCIIQSGMDTSPYVANTLLNAYIKCGGLLDARRVFDDLEMKSVVTWTMMIAGYAKSDDAKSAVEIFKLMSKAGARPDKVTYGCILKAFANPLALNWGKEVHACIRHAGFESDVRVGTALVQMYAKCGCIIEARQVFDKLANRNFITWSVMIGAYAAIGNVDDARRLFDRMKTRDLITWNIMIGAYAEGGRGVEARGLFLEMRQEGFEPNAITYLSILNPSASAGALEWVKEVHGHASKAGLESDLRVVNALVHMYAKSGSLDDAQLVFDRIKKRDLITWTVMIGAFAESGRGIDAYRLFLEMRREGFEPGAITYVSILNSSASAGALDWVTEVHGHARKAGLESDLRVGNALVHMYSNSGSMDDARRMFDRMDTRDVVTWNSMIGGLAQHGCGHEALELFRKMSADLVKPNRTTFVAVLSACCHAGLVDDGRRLFLAMTQDYGIAPEIVHYNCMVDLLGRAGDLEDAKRFISDMPVEPDSVTWTALLGACRTYGDVELGELAANKLFKLEPNKASAYVLLSNIYAAAGKWEKALLVRTMMQKRGVRKEPGCSWIEVDNKIHEFVAGDTSHPDAKAIHTYVRVLTEKLKAEGYVPDTQIVLQNLDEEGKELALCSHSEKLAIAYGLMRIPRGNPIRVHKNLRVCSDCHTATKFISKVTGRQIIASDANRFHHFNDGVCSCGDYW